MDVGGDDVSSYLSGHNSIMNKEQEHELGGEAILLHGMDSQDTDQDEESVSGGTLQLEVSLSPSLTFTLWAIALVLIMCLFGSCWLCYSKGTVRRRFKA